jgi:colanic acid biosynthesis protein WcaH
MFLARNDFAHVIRHTPLASIDLVVRDPEGRVLVGLRSNKPAQGSWFVPGGRVYKDERLDVAFARITRSELGIEIARREAEFLGVYEHLYDDNALDEPGVTTHYIVLAYEVRVDPATLALPNAQHDRFRWLTPDELRRDTLVHENTRAYFAP